MQEEEHRHLNQFIVHSALDPLEDAATLSSSCYLKVIDRYISLTDVGGRHTDQERCRFNDWMVSGYITPSNVRMLLLHDVKNEDGIKSFFTEIHELYIKVLVLAHKILLDKSYRVGSISVLVSWDRC